MAKRKTKPKLQEDLLQNPVAKYMHRFNKAVVHDDKKHYRRSRKYKGLDPFPMPVSASIGKGSGLSIYPAIISGSNNTDILF